MPFYLEMSKNTTQVVELYIYTYIYIYIYILYTSFYCVAS